MDKIFGLIEIFGKISQEEQTGTLKLVRGEQEVYIYFKNGNLQSLTYPHKRSVLAEGLMRCSKFPKQNLDAIFAEQVKMKKTLLTALQESNLPKELKDTSFIVEICRAQISEDIYDILMWPDTNCEFSEHQPPEGIFEAELIDLPVNLNPGALTLEGARRKDEWETLIRPTLKSNKDVPFLVGSKDDLEKIKTNLLKSKDSEVKNADILDELLNAINGIRDFDEIVEQVRMPVFQAMKLLAKLTNDGHICLKSAPDLKQMASLEILQKDIVKCIKLYERAEELGLKNMDTIRWLSKAYENSGLTNKAVEKYRELGQVAIDANEYTEAIRAYSKVVQFAPEDLEGYDKLKNSYIKSGRLDKAAEISAIYARKVAVVDKRRAIAILDEANRNYPSSHSNLELMASLYQQMGDKQNCILTYNILANLMKKQDNLEQALDAYRKMLTVDASNVKAHLEIAKGLIELQKTDEGVQQYKQLGQLLHNTLQSNQENLEETSDLLIQVCEAMIQFEPDNIVAREWLVDACMKQNDQKNALNILRELLGLLQREDNLEGLVTNLRKIVKMDGEDFQSRKRLADTLLRLNNRIAAIKEYTDLGMLSYKKNDMRRAKEAFDAIIAIDTFHLQARQKRAETLCHLNLHARAIEEYKLVGYLSKAIEKIPDAIEAFSKMVELAPEKEMWGAMEVARLCEMLQEYKKAITYYKRYAYSQKSKSNYGEVHFACSRILCLEPNHTEALAIKKEAEAKFSELSPYLQKTK